MKEYLLSVVAAAIISGIVTKLLGSKGTQGAVGKLIGGLFLAFAVISPLRCVKIGKLSSLTVPYSVQAQSAVEAGKNQTRETLRLRIKEGCEAYILDKAQSLDVALEVEVLVSQEDIPAPTSVQLRGNISPNAKARLCGIIAEDLGIPKEAQKWT